MSKNRDFKAEYQRRIANAKKRGLSRSQARGHARHGEAPVKPRAGSMSDHRLEAGLKALRQSGSQSVAAKKAGISPERLRRFIRENALAERTGKRWRMTDNRSREMIVLSQGSARHRLLLGHDQASLNGSYLNAVKSFLNSNDIDFLRPFAGQSVIDAKGKAHRLETDPNAIHRIASSGSAVFHDIYRLIF